MTEYTHTTLAQFRARLASLLGDASMVFWTSDELDGYIAEALRWWGLTAMYFRETASFDTVSGQAFYDLPSVMEDISVVKVQDFTLTDRDLINDCAYALMEPPIGTWAGGWIGTEMFTLADVSQLLAQSRDDILKMSGLLTVEEAFGTIAGQSRVDLDDDVIQVVRGAWDASDATPLPLWATDSIQDQTTIRATWSPQSGRPKAFSINYTPQLSVDLWPPPIDSGQLRLYTTNAGATFDPTVTATVFGLPDDACWIAKYRALEDLLAGDGLSRAWKQSQYCHQRVLDGLASLGGYETALWVDINGRRAPVTSLAQLDQLRPRWQSESGAPKRFAQLSWNQVALYPVPDGVYSVVVETVRKAPVPTTDVEYIPVGRESLQAILDYAQHAASFKMQGGEFESTQSLYTEAMEQAMDYRAQIMAQSLIGGRQTAWQTRMDRWSRPYRARQLAQDVAQEVAAA